MDAALRGTGRKNFADGQTSRDLRQNAGPDAPHAAARGHADDAGDCRRALEIDGANERWRRIELPPAPDARRGAQRRWRGRRPGRRTLAAATVLIALGAVAPVVWNYLQSYESTDDAQIDGHIDPIGSRIYGTVIRVHVEDNDRVKAGDLLVEIDPRDYEVAVAQARARVELAIAQLAGARQDYAAALANVRESAAADFKAQRDAQRFSVLLARQVVAQDEYDRYIAAARVDAAKVDAAGEAAGAAQKAIAAREADVHAARAALEQALLNLSYTAIRAPANGIVGKRSVELGSRIEPGQTLMFVTETDEIWVTANFKETQLARMHRGEKVSIHVDTFGRDYSGYVRHLPGASGDRFSLLPAENATGNYVKVVQRLPVRIEFNPGQDTEHRLHPGMSVEPTVWLRQER